MNYIKTKPNQFLGNTKNIFVNLFEFTYVTPDGQTKEKTV